MSKLDEINIPEKCTHIKIDIGLSYCAPIANKFLLKEPNVYVMGFEPNIECVTNIVNGTCAPSPFPDFILEKRFVDSGRFQCFPYALSNVDKLELMDFYINRKDYGTSSLFKHNQTILGPIKNVTKVPVISLKMVLDKIPWDRFKYIDYIKIDAQGSDLNILKSAQHYLSEKVVYVTAEPDGYYYIGADNCNSTEMDKYMESINFIKIDHPNTADPTYLNSKFIDIRNKIWIHQCGPWPDNS